MQTYYRYEAISVGLDCIVCMFIIYLSVLLCIYKLQTIENKLNNEKLIQTNRTII